MAGKRKRGGPAYRDDDDPVKDVSSGNGFGVAQMLSQLNEAGDDTETPGSGETQQESSTVGKQKRKRVDGEKVKYPVLTYVEGRLQSSIR